MTASITKGNGAVRDIDVSPDGTKIVFSLRLPLNPKKKNTDVTQPNWKLYEYNGVTQKVTQLTTDDITSGHDVGARYLPDGRIIFSSTRQIAAQSILLDEGRPQYQAQTDDRQQSIFLLHVMNADGTGMHQITFNTNHDFAPSVMSNGQIVFSRYEVVNGTDQISLYRCNPDGTGVELFYGANSHATGANIAGTNNNVIQFLGARQRADGKLIALARPFLGTSLGGDALVIDANSYVEIHQQATPTGAASGGTGQTSATGVRHHDRCEHAIPWGSLHFDLPAVRRHESDVGELVALPGRRQRKQVSHRSLRQRQHQRHHRATGAAAVHALGV